MNSAKRLLLIIEEGAEENINPNTTCREAWKKILKVPSGDEALLTSRIGKAMALIGEVKDDLSALENVNSERYLGWVPSLTTAFSAQNLDTQWNTFTRHIDNHTIDYLSNSSDILDSRSSINTWNIGSITDVAESISELISEILSSNLHNEVKSFMVQKLRELQVAIDEYQITGNKPILSTIESVFGHLYLNKEFRDSAKSESSSGFWGVVGKLVLITSLTTNCIVIGNDMTKYLPAPLVEQIESLKAKPSPEAETDIEDAEYEEVIELAEVKKG